MKRISADNTPSVITVHVSLPYDNAGLVNVFEIWILIYKDVTQPKKLGRITVREQTPSNNYNILIQKKKIIRITLKKMDRFSYEISVTGHC
jgi:hypothetical protein